MKKAYLMLVAFVLTALGATNVNAADEIRVPLTADMMFEWNGWDQNATKKSETPFAGCSYVIGESTGQPYGDGNVNAFADLSIYNRLEVTCIEGTPRILMNRDTDGGQCSATESESHLIDNTNSGCMTWASKYFKQEDNVWIVDLKQLVKDKGYAHLHAIKGANWANCTVTKMELVRDAKVNPIGWTSIINNGSLEGEDNSSFYTKVNKGNPELSVITDGVGRDGSRGIVVNATEKVSDAWDNQFWIRFNEDLPVGAKYRVSFDYRADADAKATTQAHCEPSDYIHWAAIGDVNFTTEWQTFEYEGEVSSDQSKADKPYRSIAFNLNELAAANNYYFDNLKTEVFKLGTVAEFSNDVIKVDYGFDTNIAELVKKCGKQRLLYPLSAASVTVNGKAVGLYSVEGFGDGRFYIFLQEAVEPTDLVTVSVNNPSDEAYCIKYTSGPSAGEVVKNIAGLDADYNPEIEENDGYPYTFLTPIVVKADPENGSFNLPNSIKDFKLVFDKVTDCAALQATFNGKKMTVTPADGFAEEVTLTREGTDDLPTGEYTIKVTKIYPEERLADEVFGDTTLVVNIGKVVLDPSDVAETAMTDGFADGGLGWLINSGGTMQAANSSAGCRIISGGANAGMGFTPSILYLGSRADNIAGVAVYGIMDQKLTLKAKTYHFTLDAARWDGGDNPRTVKLQVLPEMAIDAADGGVLDDTKVIAEETKAITAVYKSSTDANSFDLSVAIPEEGNYAIRIVTGNADGNPAAWNDASAIGNVKVEYLPNTAGAEWIRLLTQALEKARTARDANTAERYNGEAFDALAAAITKYETEMENYTAPSAYTAAADDLTVLIQAMNTHHNNCDNYDTQIKAVCDIVRQNVATKFNKTEFYSTVVEAAAKYNATSEWRNINEDPEGEPNNQLFYYFDELKDDATLVAAATELKALVDFKNLLFTEGESKATNTGIQVLVERFRVGYETLKKLGVDETLPIMNEINSTIFDDDELAENMKKHITDALYSQLKNADNTVFQAVENTETGEMETPTYDMTAFIKNPNVYAVQFRNGCNAENVPGWNIEGAMGIWCGWNDSDKKVAGISEDASFTIYHNDGRAEQTISDLPAGIYNLVIDAARWDNPDETNDDGTLKRPDLPEPASFVYYKTSSTPAVEDGAEENRELNYAGTAILTYHGQYVMNHDNVFENIQITDGILTFGVKFTNDDGQYFSDKVKLYLVAPAAGFDYAAAYQQFLNAIDVTTAQPAKVIGFELYDLNGRRVATAQQGITIVKKYMNDGTIQTEKMVKK